MKSPGYLPEISSNHAGDRQLRRLALFLGPAFFLALVACFSVLRLVCGSFRQPTQADWQKAAVWLRQERDVKDLLVFAPAWIDPLGRRFLGDEMSLEMAGRMDAASYDVIWEVSSDGTQAPETANLGAFELEQRFGPLRVRRYRNQPATVVFDFTRSWSQAIVSGASQVPVRRSLEEVGFQPHYCIKVVPRSTQTVRLRYTDIPLGQNIVGYVGLADVFTRRSLPDPGQLRLRVNDTTIQTVTAGADDGWVRFEAPTTPGQAVVEFELTALGTSAQKRQLCFAAEARR